jgi:hypothetical protein
LRKQPLVTNAIDPQQQQRARDVDRVRRESARADLRTLLETPTTRRLTWDRLQLLFAKMPVGDSMLVGLAIGRQYEAATLRQALWDACKDDASMFELLQLMEREAFNRERLEDGQRESQNAPDRRATDRTDEE